MTLAILALCAGGVALVYSHMARAEAEESKRELRELERLSEFAERIRDFEGDLRDVAGEAGEFIEIFDEMFENLIGQTEDGFRRVSEQRQRMNETISRLAETVRALDARIAELEQTTPLPEDSGSPVADAPDEGGISSEIAEQPEGESESRIYRIQPGDTLTRIAREHGVSLTALQNANSEVDPNRLQIGEEIAIP